MSLQPPGKSYLGAGSARKIVLVSLDRKRLENRTCESGGARNIVPVSLQPPGKSFEGVWVQTTVIAAQARLYRVRRGSGVGGGTRVQILQHMCFHVFLCGTPGRVRAFRHLASDSPPCACPTDLPRAQALGQELFLGDQKGLPLSSRSKIRANGCRGEATKRLQSGRPVSRSFAGLSLCSRFGAAPPAA